MELANIWYVLLMLLFVGYAVLDGFDIGVGIIYRWVARDEGERRLALTAIGPVWNGNEVWLIAGGGLLVLAFPKVYASSFSGFYLAFMVALWLLVVRGLALELRSHIDNGLWRTFWDAALLFGSFVLALVYGVAMGNVLRGVPIDAHGDFFEPLWTNFQPWGTTGVFDWYTVVSGVLGTSIFCLHGANYLAMKTEGEMARRADRVGWWSLGVAGVFMVLLLATSPMVQPALLKNYQAYPASYVLVGLAVAMIGWMIWAKKKQNYGSAFIASAGYVVMMLLIAAWAIFPNLLISTVDQQYNLGISNASASEYALKVALIWFSIAMPIAIIYMGWIYYAFRGKVRMEDAHY